ncbi:MAG: pyridoxal phosphate-dependent aminotransferase [Gammaproteobacteria bacterium]
MTITLAERVSQIAPSATMAMNAKASEMKAEGKNVINLTVGEPDFDTPEHIKAAGIQAIKDGKTKYTAADGTLELKQAIANKFKHENQLEYGLDQIIVSNGAKHSIHNLLQALLSHGDEVIIPAPYWVSYPEMVKLSGGNPIIVETNIGQSYKITSDQLEAAITPKTRLVLLNSPSNPTGMAYRKAELKALGDVLQKHPHVFVMLDDIYEHILWTDEPFSTLLNASPELYDRAIVINGVSKAYAMTGWRIGYAAGPKPVIAAMKKIQGQSTSGPNSVSQAAAVTALDPNQQGCVEKMNTAFKERHDYVLQRLQATSGIQCQPSDGTFYAFPDISEAISKLGLKDDLAFGEAFLTQAEVAIVPGTAFGAPGCIRISYATSMENLKLAMDRLEAFIG